MSVELNRGQDFISTGSKHPDPFRRLGHPGKWYASIPVASGTTVFTGSLFGAGAIVAPTGTTGTIELSGGGTVPVASVAGLGIQEFSIRSVTLAAGGPIYVLLKNNVHA